MNNKSVSYKEFVLHYNDGHILSFSINTIFYGIGVENNILKILITDTGLFYFPLDNVRYYVVHDNKESEAIDITLLEEHRKQGK